MHIQTTLSIYHTTFIFMYLAVFPVCTEHTEIEANHKLHRKVQLGAEKQRKAFRSAPLIPFHCLEGFPPIYFHLLNLIPVCFLSSTWQTEMDPPCCISRGVTDVLLSCVHDFICRVETVQILRPDLRWWIMWLIIHCTGAGHWYSETLYVNGRILCEPLHYLFILSDIYPVVH